MDDIRDSFSRIKKDVKHRLRGKKYKPDRTGVSAAGETVGRPGSHLQPESCIAAGGDDGEGSTDGREVRSRDRSPQPEPTPAGGSDYGRQRRETDVAEEEVGQTHSRLDPDVKIAAGSGPGQEVEQVYPPPSTLPIPSGGKPNGA